MIYTDLLFVFLFLPVTVIISFFDRSAEYKNMILIISSLLFFSWGRPIIILLLFLTVLCDYGFGFLASSEKKPLKFAGLFASIILNAGTFVVFGRNYLFQKGGIIETLTALSFSQKLIPLGIAFYTVRGVSYVFDVFKKNTEVEKNPLYLLTYMVSYHFMFAGPVVRYGDIRRSLRERSVTLTDLNDGISRFVLGLGKAVVIAPAFKVLMTEGLDFLHTTTTGAILGFAGFAGYYFWAFEGYTDMALGLGKLGGFCYKENMSPFYVHKGVTHNAYAFNGSLTRFFSDLIVYRGDNKVLYCVSVLATASVVGLWYSFSKGALGGALIIGAFVILEKLVFENFKDKAPKILVGTATALVLALSASFFMVDSLWEWKNWALAVVGKANSGFSKGSAVLAFKQNYVLILFGIVFAVPYVRDFFKKLSEKLSQKGGYGLVRVFKTISLVFVLCLYTVTAYWQV